MSEGQNTNSREAFQQAVIRAAWKDEEFRKKLLENPREAIKTQFDVDVNAELNIKVVEEDSGEMVLVLPVKPGGSVGELSEAELDAVSGGGTESNCWNTNQYWSTCSGCAYTDGFEYTCKHGGVGC